MKTPLRSPEKKKKSEGKISKLLLGVIVGGAVGSVLGVTLSDKERRNKISSASREAFGKTKTFVRGKISTQNTRNKKTGFWHFLHKIFHGGK